jgi:hypothetical protein
MEFTAKPSGILDCFIKYHNFTHLSSQNFVFLQNKSFIFLTFPDFETLSCRSPVPETGETNAPAVWRDGAALKKIPYIFFEKTP